MAISCTYTENFEDADNAHITFLDVGQGLSVLFEFRGRYALYDTGPDSLGFVDTLLARGIDTLDWVVLSHNHRDHAGGFMEMGRTIKKLSKGDARLYVRHLYVGPDTSGGFIRDSVLRLAKKFCVPVDTLVRGMTLRLGEGDLPKVDVLWPPKYSQVGENRASVVLYMNYGVASVLLPGDLDSVGERRLLELSPMLSTDLLQVMHHGSGGSNSLDFISKVAPQYAVVSVGKRNRYGHPANSVVRKYEYVLGSDSRFYRTDRDGSVEFEYVEGVGLILN